MAVESLAPELVSSLQASAREILETMVFVKPTSIVEVILACVHTPTLAPVAWYTRLLLTSNSLTPTLLPTAAMVPTAYGPRFRTVPNVQQSGH